MCSETHGLNGTAHPATDAVSAIPILVASFFLFRHPAHYGGQISVHEVAWCHWKAALCLIGSHRNSVSAFHA